ncbi:MAG TPA: cyclase family protein [Patescibacteria group bacterium]|nr:cyclase family protein [Patescibacteria group bacterium]
MPNERPNTQDGPRSLARRDFVRSAALLAAGLAAAGRVDLATAEPSPGSGRVRDFIRKVQGARLFDLASVWDENSPIAAVNPTYSMELAATHAGTRGAFGDGGKLSFTAEVQHWSGQHGAPSIDAIGHIGHNGLLFGGVDAAAATADPRGIGRSGVGAHLDIVHYPTDLLVNRGVLLDVARFVNGNLAPLPPQFEITARHLARAAKAQRVELERGDTVLIRTGWGQYFGANPTLYKGDFSPGPGLDGARFLIDAGARVVGNDTLTFEQRPPIVGTPGTPSFQVFPVHMLLIADNGINIIENFFLEELAQARVYEFLLVVPPLKIRGGTGSALRSFALTPGDEGD